MGKQVWKVGAWGSLVDSHMFSNFNAFRFYWSNSYSIQKNNRSQSSYNDYRNSF